ncbi:hypothetical protein SAM23877_p063 (plasmid) [Streptomyces ambofaciens ATCC 23877]|uniref:Uncharacterized protein n=1 Tax=Streptomyces ambofaciens (strain ATCC 23877 / 3486 / DSM 40053 / JCM 4204 / NBRC 12836 / NRRL B-2516) TaxID=278992 RepID=A0A0K2B6S2_STRA7|nr:hypothetical protein [Streptomyces ambofaciens]AKZ60772.1 hypothetical protein SAM23877_p063 [Streptomyces ambofaciens ATCC 23877]
MTMPTFTTDATSADDNSYNAGYFDGELDAISKLPARQAHDRASMADQYDRLWAQGYADGYLHQIQVTHALAQNEQTA